MPEIDFDPRESDLRIGLEVEYPIADSPGDKLRGRGNSSNNLQSHHRMPSHIEGSSVYDGTVGLEIVSEPLQLADAPAWYADVINHVEEDYNEPFQPTGLMDGGSTAGLHVHISDLSRSQAESLMEMSREPWMKVLFCSSIASDDDDVSWPVFRGGRYCQMNMNSGHYGCVNHRSGGHYEWRMPEPMIPEHVEVMVEFLTLFEQDEQLARDYAQDKLDQADDRITSIRRAERVGMDLAGMPEVRRASSQNDPENFYSTVADSWAHPEIYTIDYNGDQFYTFDTELDGRFEVEGITFTPNSVLYTDSLNEVQDDELRSDVRSALQNRGRDGRRETDATDELKKIVKKKKESSQGN